MEPLRGAWRAAARGGPRGARRAAGLASSTATSWRTTWTSPRSPGAGEVPPPWASRAWCVTPPARRILAAYERVRAYETMHRLGGRAHAARPAHRRASGCATRSSTSRRSAGRLAQRSSPSVTEMQDHLGLLNDADVAARISRELAERQRPVPAGGLARGGGPLPRLARGGRGAPAPELPAALAPHHGPDLPARRWRRHHPDRLGLASGAGCPGGATRRPPLGGRYSAGSFSAATGGFLAVTGGFVAVTGFFVVVGLSAVEGATAVEPAPLSDSLRPSSERQAASARPPGRRRPPQARRTCQPQTTGRGLVSDDVERLDARLRTVTLQHSIRELNLRLAQPLAELPWPAGLGILADRPLPGHTRLLLVPSRARQTNAPCCHVGLRHRGRPADVHVSLTEGQCRVIATASLSDHGEADSSVPGTPRAGGCRSRRPAQAAQHRGRPGAGRGTTGGGRARALELRPAVFAWLGPDAAEGLAVMRMLRGARSSARTLYLTPRSAESERLAALAAGVDEVLSEPISRSELVGRLRLLLRRARPVGRSRLTIASNLELDLDRRAALA